MKRSIFVFLLAAVLCMTAAASAVELTWDQSCTQKTSAATTLYTMPEDHLVEAGTLAAGTYIRTNGLSAEGKTGITYSNNNSTPLQGYIDGSVIVSATQTVTLPSGRTVTVGEALVRSRQALNLWLEMEYNETLDGTTYVDENGVEHDIGNEAAGQDEGEFDGDAIWRQGINRAAANNGTYTSTVYRDDEGNEIPVQVRYMGLARSMVVISGEEKLVETWRLSWETDAPEDKVIAVVQSPSNQGTVKLHSGAGANTTILTRVTSNRVVRVVSYGKNWTLVDVDDAECPRGYIATPYLELLPNRPLSYQPALLSVLGRTRGSDPVWIRAEDSANGRRIAQFDLGTPLSVYAQNEKWSEVDVGGYHAYILTEFVTLEEITADAE